METTVKKREWVKDAAIIFLAVLLVLTFFSNTIMNRSLPEVATAAVSSGSIVAKVRGTGTVTATGKHQVKSKEIRTIRSVMVKVGQEVNVGDVLFVLGQGDETELEQAKERLRTLQYEYERTAVNAPIYDGSSYDHAVDSAYEKMIRAEQKYYNASDDYYYAMQIEAPELTSINQEIDQIQQQLTIVENDLRTAEEKYNMRIAEAWFRVEEAQKTYDEYYFAGYSEDDPDFADAITALNNAKEELASIENDSYVTSLRTQRDYLLNRYDALNSHRDGMLTSSTTALYKSAMDEAEYELYLAQLDYDNALNSRAYSYQSFDQNVAVVSVNLQEIAANIAIQQEKIKALAGDEENVITADVSGTIDTIDCTAGDTVAKDALLCTIEVPDMGHTLSFSVTNDQAQRLRIGDTATISNYYWGNSVTATLTTIRTDPKNPQSNKVLTFDLEGDVTSGAEMTISVGQKSANYDTIVPNSAIKSDTNGRFVLAVQVKSSPLGNRYTARRVSVEVLANDDNNSAIVADLSNGDYVITTSSAPVSSGDMVRIADNQT